jgi:hypothetical protein
MAGGFFDFSRQRTTGGAVLFYLAAVFVATVIVTVCTKILFPAPPEIVNGGFEEGFKWGMEQGQKIAPYINIGMSVLLSMLSLQAKNMFNGKGMGLLALTVALALFIGSLGGIAVPAYLTTQPKSS